MAVAAESIPTNNKVDEFCFAKLSELNVPPSELCTDPVFLRRVYLDVIGLLPTPTEARAFLNDSDPHKREKLIDQLLVRGEFADYWGMKWGDLLRIKSEYPVRLWPKAVVTYQEWVRRSIITNKPYDRFVRELVTSTGSNFRDGPANYFRAVPHKDPQTFADITCLLFLGQRMGCVRCHPHPSERWTLADEQGVAAFFSKVRFKSTSEWKEEIVYVDPDAELADQKTHKALKPRFPGGDVLQLEPGVDPRSRFADWLTAPDNTAFNQNAVNRIWFWLFGRGIVHEPDDMRPSNPPSNPLLLDYLARELVESKYDTKHIIRLILNSRTYQLSSKASDGNREDVSHFSHYPVKRLQAEQLLDAIMQVTQTHETFVSYIPEPFTRLRDFRAIDLPDGSITSAFLDLFGRPSRDTPFHTERSEKVSLVQVLNLLNSPDIEKKLTDSERIERLIKEKASDIDVIDEFYLAALSRFPTADEQRQVTAYMSDKKRSRALAMQDLLWAILNSREFLFNH